MHWSRSQNTALLCGQATGIVVIVPLCKPVSAPLMFEEAALLVDSMLRTTLHSRYPSLARYCIGSRCRVPVKESIVRHHKPPRRM